MIDGPMMDFTDWDNYFVANPKNSLSSKTPQATSCLAGQKTVTVPGEKKNYR